MNKRDDLTEEEKKIISEQTETLRQFFIYELIKQLITTKIVCITYVKNNKEFRKFFELRGDTLSFYSDQEKRINLHSIIENKQETLFFKDIVCYVFPSNPADKNYEKDLMFKNLDKKIAVYNFLKQEIEKNKIDYDLDSVFFDSQLNSPLDINFLICLNTQDLTEFYSPTVEQLNKHRQTMIELLKKESAKQKEIITNEFRSLQQENQSLQEDELQSILSFLEDIETNTTFQDCDSIFKMFDTWPTILTSPVAPWLHKNPWIS